MYNQNWKIRKFEEDVSLLTKEKYYSEFKDNFKRRIQFEEAAKKMNNHISIIQIIKRLLTYVEFNKQYKRRRWTY